MDRLFENNTKLSQTLLSWSLAELGNMSFAVLKLLERDWELNLATVTFAVMFPYCERFRWGFLNVMSFI